MHISHCGFTSFTTGYSATIFCENELFSGGESTMVFRPFAYSYHASSPATPSLSVISTGTPICFLLYRCLTSGPNCHVGNHRVVYPGLVVSAALVAGCCGGLCLKGRVHPASWMTGRPYGLGSAPHVGEGPPPDDCSLRSFPFICFGGVSPLSLIHI